METDDEFPQIHADGAFSADAMTNDIGRADKIVRPNLNLPEFPRVIDLINRFGEIL